MTDSTASTGSAPTRILVMDDEKLVRSVLERLLIHLGYEVVAVGDGLAAADSYRAAHEAGKPFDAVVLDLAVPGGMGGEDALMLMRQVNPEVLAIVSSGSVGETDLNAEGTRSGFAGVIGKPYTLDNLRTIMISVLGTRSR